MRAYPACKPSTSNYNEHRQDEKGFINDKPEFTIYVCLCP
jgi:hypothetical protein